MRYPVLCLIGLFTGLVPGFVVAQGGATDDGETSAGFAPVEARSGPTFPTTSDAAPGTNENSAPGRYRYRYTSARIPPVPVDGQYGIPQMGQVSSPYGGYPGPGYPGVGPGPGLIPPPGPGGRPFRHHPPVAAFGGPWGWGGVGLVGVGYSPYYVGAAYYLPVGLGMYYNYDLPYRGGWNYGTTYDPRMETPPAIGASDAPIYGW